MKFRDCTSINSTENIQEGYRKGLSKTALEFKNCKQQLFTLTMRLAACLWAQILARPRLITRSQLRRFLQNVMTIDFRDWFFSFQHKGKISYRKYVHHNPCSKYASRCWEKREWLHVLWDNWNYFLKFVRIEQKAWKHSAERYCD